MHNIKQMNAKTENECKHKSHTQILLNADLIFQLLNHYHQFHNSRKFDKVENVRLSTYQRVENWYYSK